ncbi:family A G protein-coupled receptor-like protein [Mollisia scopiformis]|uniref:Family A G protein-coupled receptor-like protein n=1 Tax=Mollisia scopiformis TaxID=149040 RepID=A0A194X8Q7_MOLSC|nr:family A G protein-coupled receptor-like protein [Mollisia scopiformis]KUJ16167.1 family A G protein-coupled receptor-like protein [Mollisia scopiformis]
MAPFSAGMANAVHDLRLESRGLGGNNTGTTLSKSASQGNTLQILACTFSAISVTSAMLAFLWFVKMRRTFRHDLIMLLIQSDMFKALWFMIYPIVVFTHGPVPDSSTFCQVTGFFLSLGIEASDFAALMIALHTALYIFRPRSSNGEGGLFPYRHIAYTLWIILPILSASLAFVNKDDGYVSDGTYCYLPVRPFWYRLALAWIPRYIIFIFILGIYASIYYYVRYKFNGFEHLGGMDAGTVNTVSSGGPQIRAAKRTVPPTPTLVSHGLIPESRQSSMAEPDGRKQSVSTVDSARYPRPSRVGAHRFIWGSFSAGNGLPPTPPSETSNVDEDSFTGPSPPHPIPLTSLHTITPRPEGSDDSNTAVASRATSWRDGFVRRFSPELSGNSSTQHSVTDIFTILRHHPDSSNNLTPVSQLQLINSRGQTFAAAEMIRTRDKIRRQLRFLFIYPLVYMGMWILPFVSHVLQYDDRFAVNPPFGLTCVTTICICSQAAVDCWLFSTREKPWRQIPGTDGTFWASLKLWSGWGGLGKRVRVHGPGKSREEMAREARAAYQRRDEELAQRRNQTDSIASVGEAPRRGERSWWEAVGADGTMSPVSEEVSNPMENVITITSEGVASDDATLQEPATEVSEGEDGRVSPGGTVHNIQEDTHTT